MHRHIARSIVPIVLASPILALFGGCGTTVVLTESIEAGAPPIFAAPDADTGDAEAGLTAYCPSNKCPVGFSTCPNSLFLCDIDLQTDVDNCGACGAKCDLLAPPNDKADCVDGHCVLRCAMDGNLDCDGFVDTGCETRATDDKNCGSCGNICSDPDKPCVVVNDKYQCGCNFGQTRCGANCVDLNSDDANCGACGRACDPLGDGGALPANAYYGCVAGECGRIKCNQHYADCDRATDASTGCEAFLGAVENCGACGNVCAPGQRCNQMRNGFECRCSAGLTNCGACVDLATDPGNCGACGYDCGAGGVCTFGTCNRECPIGRADCNGNSADGCEVNTQADPMNCGGCGILCNAVAGQACVGGRCAVEPCGQVDGGPVAR